MARGKHPCILCGTDSDVIPDIKNIEVPRVECSRCGTYRCSLSLKAQLEEPKYSKHKQWLSIYTRHHPNSLLTTTNFEEIVGQLGKMPLSERIERALAAISENSGGVGKSLDLNWADGPSLCFCTNVDEMRGVLTYLESHGFIDNDVDTGGCHIRLTVPGAVEVEQLMRSGKGKDSDQAFVAMWFSSDTDEAYREGFAPAISKCGFRPIRIDLKEHNDKICDAIIAEIRRSRFLVADFTGQRPGVYFEAGFAKGLGLSVIWTCRKDEAERLHFDTRQYNHILWETPADLAEKLALRIQATV